MKKLLFGNEAIAFGAIRAGVSVVTGCREIPAAGILETVTREAPNGAVYAEWSVNENAALEVAAGAAVSGARALVVLRQAGLNIASDPLMGLNCLGVSGGLVVVVVDDPGPFPFLSGQDSRHFCHYAKLAVLDPCSVEEAYLMAADAFNLSEKYGRPVVLRPTVGICRSYASVDLGVLPVQPKKDALGSLKSLGFSEAEGYEYSEGRLADSSEVILKRHEKLEANIAKMRVDFSSYKANSLIVTPDSFGPLKENSLPGGAGRLGIAAGGVCYAYAMEVLNPMPPGIKILKIGTLPFPEDLALRFLEGLNEVLVIEELDPVIEDELIKLCGSRHLRTDIRGKRSGDMPRWGACTPVLATEKIESFFQKVWIYISDFEKEKLPDSTQAPPMVFGSLSSISPASFAAAAAAADAQTRPLPEPPPLPARSPALCAGCSHREGFLAVREAVRKYGRGRAVFSGDLGYCAIGNGQPEDLCIGAGIAVAQGMGLVEPALRFAFTGYSAFFHTGIAALANAFYSRSDIIVVVLDSCTAGENVLGEKTGKPDIPALAAALGINNIFRANPFDKDGAETAAKQAMAKTGVRLIIFEAPGAVESAAAGEGRL